MIQRVGQVKGGHGVAEQVALSTLPTRHDHSLLTISDLRKALPHINGNGSINGTKESRLRSVLGIKSFDGVQDLDSPEGLGDFLLSSALGSLGYFDSIDFLQQRLPDESFFFVSSGNGDGRNIEDLPQDEKRKYILERIFDHNYYAYLKAFREKLVHAAREASKLLLFSKLLQYDESNFDQMLANLEAESPEELNRVVRDANSLRNLYSWAIDSLNSDPDSTQELYAYTDSGSGQRKFCRDYIDNRNSGNGTDGTLGYLVSWVGKSPEKVLQARVVLEEIFENVPLGGNKVAAFLSDVVSEIDKETSGLFARRPSWGRVFWKRAAGTKLAAAQDRSSFLASGDLLGDISSAVVPASRDVFLGEKELIDGLITKERRALVRKTSKWTGGIVLVGALASAGVGTVNYMNSVRFERAFSRVESEMSPYLKIDYTKFYNDALTEMGTAYPPEAVETISTVQDYARQRRVHADFTRALNEKYFKILAAYLAPELLESTVQKIRSGGITNLPDDLKLAFPNDLRVLFSKDEWNFTEGPLPTDRVLFGHLVTQGMVKDGKLLPNGVLEFIGSSGGCDDFLHPRPFPAYSRKPIKLDFGNWTYSDKYETPSPEKDSFGMEPKDYVDVDPELRLIIDGLKEMLSRIERKKQEILTAYSNSSEVRELNDLLTYAGQTQDLGPVRTRRDEITKVLDQRQKELAPVLRGIARCECRLRDLIEVRIPKRINDIKTRNSYRAVLVK